MRPGGFAMQRKKYLGGMLLLCFLTLPLMGGCGFLGNYASIDVASGQYNADIQELVDNWQKYNIAYAGLSVKSPSAILFDTKIDGRSITYDKWVLVTDRSTVEEIVKWLDSYVNFPPTLYKITLNDQLFGYIYTSPTEQAVFKKVDDKTLYAEDIPLPPFDYGPGGRN